MPYVKIENEILKYPPLNDGNRFNVNTDVDWLTANGYTFWTNEQVDEWLKNNVYDSEAVQEFESACADFRQVCAEIGELIGVSDFHGGYDDMPVFYSHSSYRTIQGLCLAMAWSGCNERCVYTGSKVGYGQPAWWYKCWESPTQ
jgi:hypothetical protein